MYPSVIYGYMLSKEQICSLCDKLQEGNGADIAGRVGELKANVTSSLMCIYRAARKKSVCALFISKITVQLGSYKCSPTHVYFK